MREKVVLIGAGSAMFTRGLVADVLRRGWECELGLVDIDSDALAVAEGLCKKMIEAKRAPVKLAASTDRRELLPGATAVITTIGVGGRRGWEQDVFIPRKYGIYQPVGDSVMPGGTSRCLRMIPPMVAIAEDVLDLAPTALFFNYGNPMSVVCRAVRKATRAEVTGLCIGVFEIGRHLARLLSAELSEFEYTAVGINHLTWFTEIRVRGEDAMPRLRAVIDEQLSGGYSAEYLNTGSQEHATAGSEDGPLDSIQPLCSHLFQLFGAYPAVGDRHVSEFFPVFFPEGKHFGKTLGVDRFSFEHTIASGDRIYAEMREKALSAEPLGEDYFARIGGEHEQAIDIMESIRRDLGRVYSANLPNQGQVPNLPPDAIVEAPAVATGVGMKALAQRPLPAGVAGTLAQRYAWVETVVEAALEGSRGKFIQALALDGWVTNLDTAGKLADELLAAHAKFLPQFGN
jgi:alpha-galactosidase